MRGVRALFLSLGLMLMAGDAAAVVGRPLTPVSVAGVARRTTRRAAYAGAAAHGGAAYAGAAYAGAAYAGAAAATTAALVYTLPAGCTQVNYGGVIYQRCGNTYYQPVYDGPNLAYSPVSPP